MIMLVSFLGKFLTPTVDHKYPGGVRQVSRSLPALEPVIGHSCFLRLGLDTGTGASGPKDKKNSRFFACRHPDPIPASAGFISSSIQGQMHYDNRGFDS
jgi:hypothetical protein